MSTRVEWADLLLDAAAVAGKYAPQPAGLVISIATGIARALAGGGCEVCGAPDGIDLKPADLPDVARSFRDAEREAEDRVRRSGR